MSRNITEIVAAVNCDHSPGSLPSGPWACLIPDLGPGGMPVRLRFAFASRLAGTGFLTCKHEHGQFSPHRGFLPASGDDGRSGSPTAKSVTVERLTRLFVFIGLQPQCLIDDRRSVLLQPMFTTLQPRLFRRHALFLWAECQLVFGETRRNFNMNRFIVATALASLLSSCALYPLTY